MAKPLLHSVDPRLLQLFVAIVEAGGFAAAQSTLDLSLSTISNHMTTLETRLGLTLCRRGRAGFRLTEAGEIIYSEALRLLQANERFVTRAGTIRDRLAGPVTIGLLDNIISNPESRISQALARFTETAPNATLTLITRPPNELLRDLVGGQIDLAIGSFPRVTLGLDYLDLFKERQLFYCSHRHPLFDRLEGDIDIDVIRGHRLIGRTYWGSRDLKLFAVGQATATVSDMESEAHLILSGAFLGYLPEHYAGPLVQSGELRELLSAQLGYTAQFQLASRPEARNEPRLVAAIETIRDAH
jgi:DNA-binding transcriptional LysR family regulator